MYVLEKEPQKIDRRIARRQEEINSKYGIQKNIPRLNLNAIHAIDYYEYCGCDLIEDPEYFLFEKSNSTPLPETLDEFYDLSQRMHNELYIRSTQSQIGSRLHSSRKKCNFTGSKVAQLWNRLSIELAENSTTTQATISNHERGKLKTFRLCELLQYCNIYSNATTPNEIMWGCSYPDLLDYCSKQALMDSQASKPSAEELYQEHFRKLLIIESEGHCELCDKPAPFTDLDGFPYLRLYTVLPKSVISQGSNIQLNNSVVLCPNCYQRVSVLNSYDDAATLKEKASKHTLSDIIAHAKRLEFHDNI